MTTGNHASKILFLDQSGKPGGAELCLLDIAAAFSDRCEVALLEDGPFAEMLAEAGVTTHVIPLSGRVGAFRKAGGIIAALRGLPGFMQAVAKVASRARAFDILYANTTKAAIIAAPASRIAGVPLVVHLHDIISDNHFGKLGRTALVRAANHASLIIANSASTREAFIEAGGNASQVITVPNGFHAERFAPIDDARKREIRAELGVNEHFTVGVFGRISEWKGQHVLLEALHELPEIHVVVVGDALFTEADKKYAERLRALAGNPALLGRVHFTGFRDDTPALIQAMDVVVHTSVAPEPFGRVVVEAMLSGKPIVATAPGGPGEIVDHGGTGLLVPPADPELLARAIHLLMTDRDLARKMGELAKQAATERYSIEKVIQTIADCLVITSNRLQ